MDARLVGSAERLDDDMRRATIGNRECGLGEFQSVLAQPKAWPGGEDVTRRVGVWPRRRKTRADLALVIRGLPLVAEMAASRQSVFAARDVFAHRSFGEHRAAHRAKIVAALVRCGMLCRVPPDGYALPGAESPPIEIGDLPSGTTDSRSLSAREAVGRSVLKRKLTIVASGLHILDEICRLRERVISRERVLDLPLFAVGSRSPRGVAETLTTLASWGWLVELDAQLYSLPWIVPHPYEVARLLARPAVIAYGSALHHHRLLDGAPDEICVLTLRHSAAERGPKTRRLHGEPSLDRAVYRFVKVKPERLFGVGETRIGPATFEITDIERTCLDALERPQLCGGFRAALEACARAAPHLDMARVRSYAARVEPEMGRRLGWVLERLGLPRSTWTPLLPAREAIGMSVPRLDPTAPPRGRRNPDWRLQENLPPAVIRELTHGA